MSDNLKQQIEKVKKSLSAVGREDGAPSMETKKVAKKVVKKVAKKTKSNGEVKAKLEKKARKPQTVEEGYISLAQLAEEAKITPQSARVRLRSSEVERPEGRWVFKEDSKAVREVRKVLGLPA